MGLAALSGALYAESLFSLAARRKSFLFSILKAQKESLDDPEQAKRIQECRFALRQLPMKTLSIVSHDGITLTGHWLPASGTPRRTVILMHGWRSAWDVDFGPIASFLHENGCHLLFAEERGQGASEGRYITFGGLERRDIQSWVRALSQWELANLPLYLYGVSMGAAAVLMASVLPMNRHIHGIIADCGYTSPSAIMTAVLDRDSHLPSKLSYAAAARVFRRHSGMDPAQFSALEAMKTNTIPTLFIHGDADPLVPLSMTYENYRACRAPKDLLIVPGAVHAASAITAPEAYQQKLMAFFQSYDTFS